MRTGNNIDNVNFLSENINVNEFNNNSEFARKIRTQNVDRIANLLCEKFGDRTFREKFCEIAWKLPEFVIWRNLELAMKKGRNPAKYFSWLCNKSLGKL